MAVKKIRINENNNNKNYKYIEMDDLVKYINDSFDKDLNTIKQYVSVLESLKDDILHRIDELNDDDSITNNMYVHVRLNKLNGSLSTMRTARNFLHSAEVGIQKFISNDIDY